MYTRRTVLGAGTAGLATTALAGAPAAASPLLDGRELGIVADDGSDQTGALKAAVDTARAERRTLALPPGRIRAAGVIIEGPVALTGEAGHTVLEAARDGAPVLTVRGPAPVVLERLAVDGGARRMDGSDGLIVAQEAGELTMRACRIRASGANGVVLRASAGRIEACEVAGAAQAAIFSNDARGLTISGCHIHDCANNGILVWQSSVREDGTLVTGNRIERIAAAAGGSGQNGNGINIFRAGNVIAAHNRIADCAFSAVRSNAGSYCQILGNSCSRLGEVALYAEFGFEGAIVAQNLVEAAATGIAITNFNEGGRLAVCSGNLVRGLTRREDSVDKRGTGIGAEADTLVTGNVVEDAPTAGILLGWGRYLRDVTASDNIVRNCRIGIGVSVSPGAGKALVSGNLVSGARGPALAGLHHDAVTVADLAAPEARGRAPNVTVQGNVVG